VYLAVASVAIGSGLLYQLASAASPDTRSPVGILHVWSCATAFALAIASIQIPRRPELFYNGAPVDRMFTVSAWDRLNYRWANQLMSLANKKGDFEMDDIPTLGSNLRAADASVAYRKTKRSLFLAFLIQFIPSLAKQWFLASLNVGISYLPWYITLTLLRTIETGGESGGPPVWVLLTWLGISKIAGAVRKPLHCLQP